LQSPVFCTTVRIHSVARARRHRERDSRLDTSDPAWIYQAREGDDILGFHRFGFNVSCDRKMLSPHISQSWAGQLSDACLQLHT